MAAPARYREHVDRLTSSIQNGTLAAGSRLMPHRDYADRHGIAPATVARVYRTLIEHGLAVGEVGRGTFVRSLETHAASTFVQVTERLPDGTNAVTGKGGNEADRTGDVAVPGDAASSDTDAGAASIDFAFNYPVLPEQAAQLRHALRQLSDRGDLATLLDYHPHPGRRDDREVAAAWLAQGGAPIDPADIMVCAGSQHALSVILAALATPRDLVAVEALTYPGFMSAAALLGIEVIGVRTDQDGLIPEALEAICREHPGRVRLVYTMPTVQNPTGGVMPLARREALIEVARRHRLLLVDDSVYSFLDAAPPPSLRSLAPDCVIEIHSLSKSAAPGLRVGYIVAPSVTGSTARSKTPGTTGGTTGSTTATASSEIPAARVRQRLHDGLRATMWLASPLTVALATLWMRDGTLARWIEAKRVAAGKRQALAREILGAWPITAHPTSYHLLLDLPPGWRPDDLVLALSRRGIDITPLAAFAAPRMAARRAVRIALAAPGTLSQLETGLRVVAATLSGSSDTHE